MEKRKVTTHKSYVKWRDGANLQTKFQTVDHMQSTEKNHLKNLKIHATCGRINVLGCG
jgi:hypothetical protein